MACGNINGVQIKCRNILGKFNPRAIKCSFMIENWSITLADSRGVPKRPPPPSAGMVREYPIGAQVKNVYFVYYLSNLCPTNFVKELLFDGVVLLPRV